MCRDACGEGTGVVRMCLNQGNEMNFDRSVPFFEKTHPINRYRRHDKVKREQLWLINNGNLALFIRWLEMYPRSI